MNSYIFSNHLRIDCLQYRFNLIDSVITLSDYSFDSYCLQSITTALTDFPKLFATIADYFQKYYCLNFRLN